MSRVGASQALRTRLAALAVSALGVALGLGAYSLLSGSRLPPTARVAFAPGKEDTEGLDAVSAPLLAENHLSACRAFVPRGNAYFDRHPEQQPPPLDEKDVAFLRQEFSLDEGELREITNDAFTPLDAHYLEQCFALGEAARSLELAGLPEPERARRAFAWVMRQVRLRDGDGASPPLYVLRRGWGSAWERSLVFAALLEQLGIPACLVTYPGEKGPQFWLVGAVVGENVELFEPRLGLPVPGPDGREVATLAEVRREPGLLAALNADRDLPYDVAPGQAQKAEAYPAGSLSALAPRLARLQKALPAASPVVLAVNFKDLSERYRKAGVTGKPTLGGADAPSRVLRSFLPPHEGGIDEPTPGKPWVSRLKRYRASLAASAPAPPVIRNLPESSPLRGHLQDLFERTFQEFTGKPDGPRDQLLRGHLDAATRDLVTLLDHLAETASVPEDAKVAAAGAEWCAAFQKAYAELAAAQEAAKAGNSTAAAALKEAQDHLKELQTPKKTEPVARLLEAGATPPLRAEAAYQLALAKHEEAERAQARLDRKQDGDADAVRDTWQQAAEQWGRYRASNPDAPGDAAARLLAARALAATGQREAALALVADPPARWSPWERRACLIRARLLRDR